MELASLILARRGPKPARFGERNAEFLIPNGRRVIKKNAKICIDAEGSKRKSKNTTTISPAGGLETGE